MRFWMTVVVVIFTGRCWAAEAIVTDADTLQLKGAFYRLDGIDAPETDQVCLNEKGVEWACGLAARDQLKALISKRDIQCDSKRSDPVYRNRRLGVCTIEGEPISLNQWLVREGWALNLEPYARNRFKADQEMARDHRKGLWKGCFAAPRAMRNRDKSGAVLLGSACTQDNQALRDLLIPLHPAMPEGCSIKGKSVTRAHLTGHRGIYHMESCKSYQRLKTPDRWFCSELEAQAAGFRPPFTCDRSARQ